MYALMLVGWCPSEIGIFQYVELIPAWCVYPTAICLSILLNHPERALRRVSGIGSHIALPLLVHHSLFFTQPISYIKPST